MKLVKNAITLCLVLAIIALPGCADYKHMSTAKKEFAQTESVRMKEMTYVVMEALKLIMGGFEKAAQDTHTAKPLFTKTTIVNGQTVTDTVYDSSETWANAMIQMRKADVIRDLVPMLEKIYKQQQLDISKPVTAGDVALAFVNHVPLMATVGGMYGLGVAGLNAAGNNITANLEKGAQMNVKGTQTAATNGGAVAGDGGTASGLEATEASTVKQVSGEEPVLEESLIPEEESEFVPEVTE